MAEPCYCSFCGKSQHEVFQLIAGPVRVFICDECVDECAAIVAAKRSEHGERNGMDARIKSGHDDSGKGEA